MPARLGTGYLREVGISHREIPSLDEQDRLLVGKMKEYERSFRAVIERGCSLGRFSAEFPRVASFTTLEMLNGLPIWFSETGPLSEDEVVRQYGNFALRIFGAGDGQGN